MQILKGIIKVAPDQVGWDQVLLLGAPQIEGSLVQLYMVGSIVCGITIKQLLSGINLCVLPDGGLNTRSIRLADICFGLPVHPARNISLSYCADAVTTEGNDIEIYAVLHCAPEPRAETEKYLTEGKFFRWLTERALR